MEYKPIPSWPGYSVSRNGKVIRTSTGEVMTQQISNGYKVIHIPGMTKTVHRLVAEVYIPTHDLSLVVDHINTNKTDNRVENLQWITQAENVRRNTKKISHERRVQQIDLETGDVIHVYESITEAAKTVGVKSRRSITLVCSGENKTCKGFFWAYDDPSHQRVEPDETVDYRRITGYEHYRVYKDGRIYNDKMYRYLKPVANVDQDQYYVTLCKPGEKHENEYVNRIVATAFLGHPGEPYEQYHAIHRDGDPTNNHVDNLQWIFRNGAGSSAQR